MVTDYFTNRSLAHNVSGLAVSADNERQNGMRMTELKFDLKTERMQNFL